MVANSLPGRIATGFSPYQPTSCLSLWPRRPAPHGSGRGHDIRRVRRWGLYQGRRIRISPASGLDGEDGS